MNACFEDGGLKSEGRRKIIIVSKAVLLGTSIIHPSSPNTNVNPTPTPASIAAAGGKVLFLKSNLPLEPTLDPKRDDIVGRNRCLAG